MSRLIDLTALQLARAIREGECSAREATNAYLDAIDAHDGQLHIYSEVYADRAKATAEKLDARQAAGESIGPLGGVPLAIKDNLCTDWGRTTCCSKYLEHYESPYTATVVERLEQCGAVILGKTNMDEFAMGSSTENSAFGATKNPWDPARVPGGSSGGSAAAVAARLCAAALGSDTGGSIRQPSAFCGIVGAKPTYGRVSRYGLVAFGSSLDQIGPMTQDVSDAALLLGVISGADPRDSTCLPDDVPDYRADIEKPVENLRLGVPREFFAEALAPPVREALDSALKVFTDAGAAVVDVSLPHSRIDVEPDGHFSSFAVGCYYLVATAEASSNLARFDGVHYGHRTGEKVSDIVELYSRSRSEALGPEVKRRIMLGTFALSSGYYDAYYNQALKVRRLIRNDFDRAFEQCDMIFAPATPTTAFHLGEKTTDPLEMYLADVYTISANLAGLPGVAVPAGLAGDGLPAGFQLLGPVLSEPKLLRAARTYETASGISCLRPPTIGESQTV